jgi:AraC-like DNA-binding protein
VGEALTVVRQQPVQAVLLSQATVTNESFAMIGKLAGACAGMLILVLAGWAPKLSALLLALGRYGIRDVVDVSTRVGLMQLRSLIQQPEWAVAARVGDAFQKPLRTVTDEMRYFMLRLVQMAPSISSAKVLASKAGVLESSLNSRFYRARLPSPKQYLASIRLLYAAGIMENRTVSIADVANRLHYSSPQSFGRHVREQLGMHGTEFRQKYTFLDVATHATFRLFEQHERVLRSFRPTGTGNVGW